MARNSEKAVTALARWRQLQLKEQGKLREQQRRPYMTTDEHNPRRAERWRNQVIREVAQRVAQIQNAGLGEFKIRDLNDEINKLLREKILWEDRIKELGGPDYKKIGPRLLDKEGKEVPGSKGYKYFGAAKDLPGVKELFEAEVVAAKKTRADLMKEIDAEYYGYMDDDEHILVAQEKICEKEARKKLIEEFVAKNGDSKMDTKDKDVEEDTSFQYQFLDEEDEMSVSKTKRKVHVSVPTMKEVEEAIINQKKADLLKKYISEDLMQSEAI